MHPSTHAGSTPGNRMKPILLSACLAVAIASTMLSTAASAADAANRQQAMDIAVQQNGGTGKVLGVQTMTDAKGQTVYAVKILSNGRVRVFRIRQAN